MRWLLARLRTYWEVWRYFGVSPWQYEADRRALRRFAKVLQEEKGKADAATTTS